MSEPLITRYKPILEKRLEQLEELIEKNERVNAYEIAVALNITTSYARELAKLLATKKPDKYQYIRGVLVKRR